jgi:hypothetical protein
MLPSCRNFWGHTMMNAINVLPVGVGIVLGALVGALASLWIARCPASGPMGLIEAFA